ncbi:PucR family transcriptional regulator [Rhodococcus sp. NPDC019627]|uniref:PucR family transcriptional regulator n=1 Tax=unclassified Rhodococcus (in: high G+C Gram-positive bacteria) TaxID=192944 RepID=UPI00340E89CC
MIRKIAERVIPHQRDFVEGLLASIIRDMPALVPNREYRDMLGASIVENTEILLDALRTNVDPATITPPPGAVAYARGLARRGLSLAALLRVYRVGQAQFTGICLDAANSMDEADDLRAVKTVIATVATYLDHVCELIALDYEEERERWIHSRSGMKQHWVSRLLAGTVIATAEAQRAIGYPLSGTHLAIAAWVAAEHAQGGVASDTIDRFHHLLTAAAARAHTLLIHTDETAVTIWVSLHEPERELITRLKSQLEASPLPVQVATGLPRSGIDGFRASYDQAARVKALAMSARPSPPQIVSFADVAPVAMLSGDTTELRHFVNTTLGQLAADTERAYELRETLRVYLACHRSPAAASERMILHRNTVRYRVQQASEDLGRALDDVDPFTVSAALEICRWYGSTVLRAPP